MNVLGRKDIYISSKRDSDGNAIHLSQKKTSSDVIGKGASFLNLSGAGRTARHLEFLPEPVDML